MNSQRRTVWTQRLGYALCFLAVACVFVHMSRAKLATLRTLPLVDPKDDTGLFWTESAFHYRYAKMAAAGQGIPEVDAKMQYPEGMHVLRDEMPVMERFAGWMYRHVNRRGLPFHVYLLVLAVVYSSTVLFPACLLSAFTWRSPAGGLVTCLFYALTFSFIGNVVTAAYVRQDFALPFLFLGMSGFIASIATGRRSLAAAAALLLAFSMASWHMAQFCYLVLAAGAVVLYFVHAESRANTAATLAVVSILLAVISFFVLPLRVGRFALSLPLLAGYALAGQHVILRKRTAGTVRRLLCFLGIFAVLAAAVAVASGGHYARYSHVYRLVLDKIRFFGVKPREPSQLCFESRIMWTSSFQSPTPRAMATYFGMGWLAGAAGAVAAVARMIRDRRFQPAAFLVLWMAAAFVALFVLIIRMDVLAAFFVCVLAGAVVPRKVVSLRGVVVIGAVLGMLGWNVRNIERTYMVREAPKPEHLVPLLKELRANTGTDAVILANFPLSSVICAHVDRPVVVHSKFENERVRQKVQEFYAALYKPEEVFYAFCRRYGVKYFVYEPAMMLDHDGDSIRYAADRLTLDQNSAALLMNFAPEGLRHFQLVYQSPAYRVYRVLEEGRVPAQPDYPMLPVYDSHGFRRDDLGIRPPPFQGSAAHP